MRRRFDVQLALGQIPIERVRIPLKSRDELPPILAGLQWIFQTPEINEQVLALLESKVLAGKKPTGRPGLDLWPILVLGVVRLGLDCDYDRLEDLANHHTLLRQILGVSPEPKTDEMPFHCKPLSQNVCHLDEELLAQINAIVAQAGRAVFKKKDAPQPIRAKTDSYVLETNVHFPTDLNLLWDAQRKCLDLICPLMSRHGLAGWRKAKAWRRKLKSQMIRLTRLASAGGPHKPQRRQSAARQYVGDSYRFEQKVFEALQGLPAPQSLVELVQRTTLEYFHNRRTTPSTRIGHRSRPGRPVALLPARTLDSNRAKTCSLISGVWKIHCSPARMGGSSSRLFRGIRTRSMGICPRASCTSNRRRMGLEAIERERRWPANLRAEQRFHWNSHQPRQNIRDAAALKVLVGCCLE